MHADDISPTHASLISGSETEKTGGRNHLITLVELTICVWPALENGLASPDPDSLFLLALARNVERQRTPLSRLVIKTTALTNPLTTAVSAVVKYKSQAELCTASLQGSQPETILCREYSCPLSSRARLDICELIMRDPLVKSPVALYQTEVRSVAHFPVLTLLESQLLPLYNYLWWFEPESFAKLSRPYYAATLPIYASLAWPSLERKRQLNKLFTLHGRDINHMQQRLFDDAMNALSDICCALDKLDDGRNITGRVFFSGQQQPALVDLELYAVLAPLVRMQWKCTALRMQFFSLQYKTYQRIVRYVDAVHAYCFENAAYGGGIPPADALISSSGTSSATKSGLLSTLRRTTLFIQEHFVFIAAATGVNVWLLWKSGQLERWSRQMPFVLAALKAAGGGDSAASSSKAAGSVRPEVLNLYDQHRMDATPRPAESDD